MVRKGIVGVVVLLLAMGLGRWRHRPQAAPQDWVLEGQITGERSAFVSAELPDGRTFVALRYNVTGEVFRNDTWLLDPADMTWERLADSPVGTEGSAGAYADGKVYVFGGLLSNFSYITTVLIYDLATDEWSTGPALSGTGVFMRAATIDGTCILIAGGWHHGFEKCYAFDTRTGAFEAAPDMPEGRAAGAMVAYGDSVYYFGGWDSSYAIQRSVFGYTLIGDYWWSGTPLPEARASMAGVAGSDGVVYLIGGTNNVGWYEANVAEVWGYDLSSGGTIIVPAVAEPARYGAAFETADGRIVFFGGHNGTEGSTDIWSLKVWDIEAILSSGTVAQGGSVQLSLSLTTYFAPEEGWYGTAYLMAGDITYALYDISALGVKGILELPISEGMPAQDYLLVLDVGADWDYDLQVEPLPLTVTEAPSIADQLQEMQEQNEALQEQLEAAQAELADATDAKLDATIGYVILVLVLVTLVVGVVGLVRRK
ncbi:MAG TPA: hypothetical protein PLJ11_05520 [Methanomassiliicoccales archaeon]|nr:hypothetical protein [Methanomassiliicoccales archaeon]